MAHYDIILPIQPADAVPAVRSIGLDDLNEALRRGLQDFWALPTHVIGYSVLSVAASEAHLLNVAIASEWQAQGIGRGFLDHMIGVARSASCQIVYLEVRPSNVAARHLYRKLGFQQIAIRPDYYPAVSGREDALFLGLAL